MQSELTADVEPIRFVGQTDGALELIDQTLLPVELTVITCRDVETVWEAIKLLRVRGAPAIGIAAAYGVVIGLQTVGDDDADLFWKRLDEVTDYLAGSRPTAVNLFWALDRMKRVAHQLRDAGRSIAEIRVALLAEAQAIHAEDRETCRAIGRHGAAELSQAANFLTHCNAGGLATAEYGTALAVFFTLQDDGKDLHVFVDETRPLLQGARLTAWELSQRKIPATLICDSMAAQVMREGRVDAIVTGADRIAANGDSANKIGTYSLAVLAKAHGIPFYIAAPISTFDMAIDSGDEIPIEERKSEEITHGFGKQTAPAGINVYNPAFDVTPAELIQGIITERGVISPVTREMVAQMFAGK
ncbi:S-methyl-5-thioribose-1-phosphate isomerase [Blastopirellula marina]|uniref:Methylthioribose-1-phosphate isomerase n=1 Tax=Blastopirellula marina TaxID=124 RepID=A0A2S8GT33_9BACT|nr:S-methyl-5-thioribose-1-phosphate isomerase [Blastopirellula marina]PQO47588.1 S-methyl-5-thioribose-1-phosphate isomerase [Blastopirellula marina]